MIAIIEGIADKVVGLRIDGKVLHEDYQRFVPLLEELIQKYGSARCYVEMAGFHGIGLRALWDEIKFDVLHGRQIERCAVVGARAWEEWMTKLSRPIFPKAEMRYFDLAERDQAREWIKEGLPVPTAPLADSGT